MSGPWFRRYFFSFKPICWQGYAVIVLMVVVGIPCFLASDHFDATSPLLAWIFDGLGFLIFAGGFGTVWWKMDWQYGRH